MRTRPKRILVGVDFDAASAGAMAAAGRLADATGAALFVMHAEPADAPVYFTAAESGAILAEQAQQRDASAAMLAAFAVAHAGRPAEPLFEDGPPAAALLRRLPAFDLLVVGTHRARGARRWWLGSVAEAVVRGATRPVLVVPPTEGPPALTVGTIAIAGAPDAAAHAWADAFSAALHLHVVQRESVAACDARTLSEAALIVIPGGVIAAPDPATVVHLLKECPRPVLFMPRVSAEEVTP